MTNHPAAHSDSGAALLIALLALSLFTLLGLFMSLNATSSVAISDNYESQIQATYAAMAGIHHARVLLRGLDLNDVLKGPDGAYDASAAYVSEAKSYGFRNPLSLLVAQSLNIADPAADVAANSDDGMISTGFFSGTSGTALIPITGIGQLAPNPYGPGMIVTSRYFVKVTDNNGETSEIAGDPNDNPFIDGDGIVIVRSLGIARTIMSETGSTKRRNSAVIFEARYKRLSTWDLGPALVVLGDDVDADFSGAYEISGESFPGIGTVDTFSGDAAFPDQIIREAAAGSGEITGGGIPNPSVRDITGQIRSNRDQILLLNPGYLRDFVDSKAPQMADSIYNGDQLWLDGSAPNLGAYDVSQPWNAPEQDPKITLVRGNLQANGGLSGGGLLIVTGNLQVSGPFKYNGLVLLIGSGRAVFAGPGVDIEGAVLVANLIDTNGAIAYGTSGISIGGNNRLSSNRNAVRMAVGLIPPSQISFREIAGSGP
jgi:hypothetical protein